MISRIIGDMFLILGCFFALAGTVGVLRMPDAYTRMQSSTNITTLGIMGIVIGAAVYGLRLSGGTRASMVIKIVLTGVFIVLTSPISGHAICRAAYKSGVRTELVCDHYGRDGANE